MATKNINIAVGDDLHRQLRQKALDEGTTLTAIVKDAIHKQLGVDPSAPMVSLYGNEVETGGF